MPAVVHFLLVYDLKEGRLRSSNSFDDPDAASLAYAAAEQEHRDDVEIVLVGADSIETIMRTHGHYFEGSPLANRFLAGHA